MPPLNGWAMKRQFLNVLKENGVSARDVLMGLGIQSLTRIEIRRIAEGIDPTPIEARKILKALGLPVRLASKCRLRRPASQYRSHAERRFAIKMRLRGLTMIPQPRAFKVGVTTWTPDFYCPELDIYYEVVGTSQAWSQSREKIQAVRAAYSKIRINVVNARGLELRGTPNRMQAGAARKARKALLVLNAFGIKKDEMPAVLAEASRLVQRKLITQMVAK